MGDDRDPRRPVADGPRVPDDLPEDEFRALLGDWATPTPDGVVALLDGAPFPWWLTGGWALELAGGRARPHDDVDVAFLLRDLPRLRRWAGEQGLHLWAPAPDRLRPILPGTGVLADEEQFWARRDAASPWLLDLLATPTRGRDWVFKKDHRIARPLAEVTAVVDGIPVVVPEVGLLHKAGLDRAKDRDDLLAVLPRMDRGQRAWLAGALRTWKGDHPWLAHL